MRRCQKGSGKQHPRWKGLFGGNPVEASSLGMSFLLWQGLLGGAEGIERILSSPGGCKRWIFLFIKGDGKSAKSQLCLSPCEYSAVVR